MAYLDMLHRVDLALTRIVQRLELGPLEILLVPGCTCFGWKGMQFLALPLICLSTCSYDLDSGIPSDVGALYFALLTCALGQTVNRFAKQSFSRMRPTWPNPLPSRFFALQKKISMDHGDGPSFPSGDTLGAGLVGGILAVVHKNPLYLLIAVWGSLGRQYWFFHYFFDTLVGGLVGILSAFLVDWAFEGHKNVKGAHVAFVLPVFILVQKALKKYGVWLRSRKKD